MPITSTVINNTDEVVFCRLIESDLSDVDKVLAVAAIALSIAGYAASIPLAKGLPALAGKAVLSHGSTHGGAVTTLAASFQVFAAPDDSFVSGPLFPGDGIKRTSSIRHNSNNDVEITRMQIVEEGGRSYVDAYRYRREKIGEPGMNVGTIVSSGGERLLRLQLPEGRNHTLVSQKVLRFRNLQVRNSQARQSFNANDIPGGVFLVTTNPSSVAFYDSLDRLMEARKSNRNELLEFKSTNNEFVELGFQHGHTGTEYQIRHLSDGTSVLKLSGFGVLDRSGEPSPNRRLMPYNGTEEGALALIASQRATGGGYYWAYWHMGGTDGKQFWGMTGTGFPCTITPAADEIVYLVANPELSFIYQKLISV